MSNWIFSYWGKKRAETLFCRRRFFQKPKIPLRKTKPPFVNGIKHFACLEIFYICAPLEKRIIWLIRFIRVDSKPPLLTLSTLSTLSTF